MQRYDLVQVNACYTTDHEMERADDGEWVRYEEVAALAQEIEQVKAAIRQWAIYCFQKHGNDAHLYNGLADMAGMNPEAADAALVSRAPRKE